MRRYYSFDFEHKIIKILFSFQNFQLKPTVDGKNKGNRDFKLIFLKTVFTYLLKKLGANVQVSRTIYYDNCRAYVLFHFVL
jgi:hypothetical protein